MFVEIEKKYKIIAILFALQLSPISSYTSVKKVNFFKDKKTMFCIRWITRKTVVFLKNINF